MNNLLELAERCEKAEGPDRGLDGEIFMALGIVPDRAAIGYPHYAFTASLDAAMLLVPEGWRFIIDSDGCHCRMTRSNREGRDVTGFAGSMALALCAAALRARAAMEDKSMMGDDL